MKSKKLLSVLLALVMVISLLPMAALAQGAEPAVTTAAAEEDPLKIVFLDCGRKYFSPANIKKLIDNAAAANFNAISLGIGNDGLRLLLDDMAVGTYSHEQVTEAVHFGNLEYNKNCAKVWDSDRYGLHTYPDYNPAVNELTQAEMDDLIAYANGKGLQVIPLINTPGHMNAIVSAMGKLGIPNPKAEGKSANTMNLLGSPEAVEFAKGLIQNYIDYFASKGCEHFNMGMDEYANDLQGGGFSFGRFQGDDWNKFIAYYNDISGRIQAAGMKAISFNDGVYYKGRTGDAFDTNTIISYWSGGWWGYELATPATFDSKGHKMINTDGSYYWVLGKEDCKCSPEKASGFNIREFQGGYVQNPAGAMFCIWSDFPSSMTEEEVLRDTAATIAAYGAALPQTEQKPAGEAVELTVGQTKTVTRTELAEPLTGDFTNDVVKVTLGEAQASAGAGIGSEPAQLASGKQYAIASGNHVIAQKADLSDELDTIADVTKDAVTENAIWTITGDSQNGYTISHEIDGKTYYLGYRQEGSYTNGGYGYWPAITETEVKWQLDRGAFYQKHLQYHQSWGNYLDFYLCYDAQGGYGWTMKGSHNGAQDLYEVAPADTYTQTITFEGLKEGAAALTIGGVLYNVTVSAGEIVDPPTPEQPTGPLKIVFVDSGRKYFSAANLKRLIDNAAGAGFNAVSIAIGNDGMRFILDDMAIEANGKTYASDAVAQAIRDGNASYYDDPNGNALTEAEMNDIIAHAAGKGLQIIPLLNTPGHMNTIIMAMRSLGISNPAFTDGYAASRTTIDLTNPDAVAFAKALVQKYATYFASKGSHYFNIGADEYANDIGSMGINGLIRQGNYNLMVNYINDMNGIIKAAGLNTIAFNDSFYYGGHTDAAFNNDIALCHWTSGWSGYDVASVNVLAQKGHPLINTNGNYYWTLHSRVGVGDCTPERASQFDMYQFQGGYIEDPLGAQFCIWCDTYEEMSDTEVVNQTAPVIAAFGAALPGNETPPTPDEETREITVEVGKSVTDTISGADYSAETVTNDYVTVGITYEAGREANYEEITEITSGQSYLIENTRARKLLSNVRFDRSWTDHGLKLQNRLTTVDGAVNLWTVTADGTGYTVQDQNGSYLKIPADDANIASDKQVITIARNADAWTIDQAGSYLNDFREEGLWAAGWKADAGKNDAGSQWKLYRFTPGTAGTNTVTFTGVQAGDTTVKIGHVTYNVHVTGGDPVEPPVVEETRDIEFWITNRMVTANGGTRVSVKSTAVNTEEGVEIASLVPAEGTNDGTKVSYWKTNCLPQGKHQTSDGGVDQTKSGVTIEKLRFWNDAWEYYANGVWTAVQPTDQLVAYYMQMTTVTKEVTTSSVDWGVPYSDWTRDWFWPSYVENGRSFSYLDFAIVYPESTQNPASFPVADTLFFHCEGGKREVGAINFIENANYEVLKITVTNGTATGYQSKATFAPNYDPATERTVWEKGVQAGTPHLDGLQDIANRDGRLVTIYVQPKAETATLSVHYMQGVPGDATEFHKFEIVTNGDGFNSAFGMNQGYTEIGQALHDNTVVNELGITQTVPADLTKLTTLDPQYLVDVYALNEAVLSESGKEIFLYYRLGEEPAPALPFDIVATNMIMGNNLDLMFAIPADAVPDWTGCYAVINRSYADNRENDVVTIPFAEWENTDLHMLVTYKGLAAKEMGDEMTVTVYNAEGEAISNVYTDSIRTYAMRLLGKSQIPEQKTLLVDMLNYGTAAQNRFNYDVNDPANKLLSEEQRGLASDPLPFESTLNRGDKWFASNLVLESNIKLMLAFRDITPEMTAAVDFVSHTGKRVHTVIEGSAFQPVGDLYAVVIEDLVVADARETVTVTITDAEGNTVTTCQESIEDYLARMNEVDELFASVMKFSDSAHAYLHRNDPQ